jgi:hypothetical protein
MKPMRGGLVETRGQDPRRELLEEVKAKRGSTIECRLTPTRCERTSRVHQSLEPASSVQITVAFGRRPDSGTQRQEGQSASKDVAAIGRGNPLKVKTQGRHRHETRPEGFRVEESVKRLKKPEGAA